MLNSPEDAILLKETSGEDLVCTHDTHEDTAISTSKSTTPLSCHTKSLPKAASSIALKSTIISHIDDRSVLPFPVPS